MKMKALIFAIMMAATMCACGGQSSAPAEQGSSQEGTVGLPNPMVEKQSAEDFTSELGFAIDAPEGASDVGYWIISDEILQVSFTLDGARYTYRAAKTEEDISGVYEEFEDKQLGIQIDYVNGAASVTVKTTKAGGRLGSWTTEGVQYSLYTPDKVSDDDITSLISKLAEPAASN